MGEEIVIDAVYVQGIINQINQYQGEVVRSLNCATRTLNQSGKAWHDAQRNNIASNLNGIIETTKIGVNALKSYSEELASRLRIITG